MAWRKLIAAVATALALCGAEPTPPDDHETRADHTAVRGDEEQVCSSLNGPFCAHTGAVELFADYMTPISVSSLSADATSSTVARRGFADSEAKKSCFFQHFSGHWMDSGGDAFDLLHQKTSSVDACEALCCAHPQCRSFTFWRGHTCFLRSSARPPRASADSFSGVRLQ